MHGYAINPARDFGPRLFTKVVGFQQTGFADGVFVIPIVGPCVGGLLGALTYDRLIRPFLPPQVDANAAK
jgi:glycerol uptake facilitator protein